jgi:predicted enzyme related to lactoylglutathione lyase
MINHNKSLQINPQIEGHFLSVRDIKKAVHMYCKLFDYPIHEEEILFGHLYFMPNGIILDSDEMEGRPIPQWLPVSLKLGAKNIDSAFNYVQELGFEIAKEIDRGPTVSWFLFKDPDGNTLMMCEDH